MSDHALFVVAPFVSIVVLAVLVVAAMLGTRHEIPVSVRPSAASPTGPRRPGRHPLLTIGLLGVLMGHVVMAAWPGEVARWTQDLPRLITFELALFALGLAALAGVAAAAWRGVLRRTDDGARVVDAAFLGVLLLALVSGLGVAVVYRWAAAWSAVTVTRYARSLVSLQPNLESLEAMPYLVKLHIFSSFIVVALLGFTRFLDVWLTTLLRATRVALGPFMTIADRRWRLLRAGAIRSGRNLMWPEEEED
jgi:nitrate reductase gamma subunit